MHQYCGSELSEHNELRWNIFMKLACKSGFEPLFAWKTAGRAVEKKKAP